jgi:hypothetical protein
VAIVRRHDADAELFSDADRPCVDDGLLVDSVVLELEPVAARTEQVAELRGDGPRLVVAVGAQERRNLARQAGREADDALAVLSQNLLVDPGPIVEALEESPPSRA